jgi:hypothetical protein
MMTPLKDSRFWLSLALVLSVGLLAGLALPRPVEAGDPLPVKKKDLPPALEGLQGDAAVTLFMDTSAGGRRRPAAKKMTILHAEMAARGYELVMMMPMNENNDTAGFWLTYRPAR